MGYFRRNIEDASGYMPGFQPSGEKMVKLNTNENPYPPSKKVLEAIGSITAEQLRRYPDPAGNVFRQAAAEINSVTADCIMCTNGGDDLLTIAVRAFCDSQRPLAYPVPTYSLYSVLANIQGCGKLEIPFDDEFNLPAKLTQTGAGLTILCNPNAPNGSFISVDEIASIADELTGVLLVDEAYVDFAEDDCVRLTKDFDNVIILRSMSKGYSLAGIRFGYAIARPEMINGLLKVKDSYNVDTVAIAAATAAIKDREYFDQNIEKIKSERDRLTVELGKSGFDVPKSRTNFILARYINGDAADIHKRLAEKNIYIRYFAELSDKLRITVGTPQQNNELISALKEILSQ